MKVWVTFCEIYNEQVNDLLDKNKRNLPVRENDRKECVIDGLTRKPVKTAEQAIELLEAGNRVRVVGNNYHNDQSSRSHTIFRVAVEQTQHNR